MAVIKIQRSGWDEKIFKKNERRLKTILQFSYPATRFKKPFKISTKKNMDLEDQIRCIPGWRIVPSATDRKKRT